MAISLVGVVNAPGSTGLVTSLATNVPAGVQDGDLLLWTLVGNNNTAAPTPSGWTVWKTSTTTAHNQSTFYRVASSEPASYTATGLASGRWGAGMLALRGVDQTTPADITFPAQVNGTSTLTYPAATPVTAGAWIVAIGSINGPSGTTNVNWSAGNVTTVQTDFGSNVSAQVNAFGSQGTFESWSSGAFTPTGPQDDVVSARSIGNTTVVRPSAGGTTTVGTTRATTWRVCATVLRTRATTWDVLTPVSTTRATTWDALATVATTRATTWAVKATVTATRASTWDVLSTAATTRGTTWDVLTPGVASRATTWAVKAAVTTSRATTWNVKASISATRATLWDVLAAVAASRATTWDVLTSTATSRATTWDVLTSTAATRATTWDTLATVATSRATTWNVASGSGLTTVSTSRTTTWHVKAVAATARATSWDTLAGITTTRASTWRVLAPVVTTRATTWDVASSGAASGVVTWDSTVFTWDSLLAAWDGTSIVPAVATLRGALGRRPSGHLERMDDATIIRRPVNGSAVRTLAATLED